MPSTTTTASPSVAKRQKPNVGSALRRPPGPDFDKGIQYWDGVDASVDGVLGGFGDGPVPHIEQLSSRLLLLSLLPCLSTFQNPLTPATPSPPAHRLTALDVGAGIGRVTRNVLIPLFDDVVLLEPVDKFVKEAWRSARDGEWRDLPKSSNTSQEIGKKEHDEGKTRKDNFSKGRGKRVWFLKRGLQGCDPRYPQKEAESLGVVRENGQGEECEGFDNEGEMIYDVIWCQWCLGHMSTSDLIPFLRRARSCLRETSTSQTSEKGPYDSLIFVKENCCEDGADGSPVEFLDEEDSSLTRSSRKWLGIFKEAGLEVVQEEVQDGMPEELFVVKTWALR